MKCFCGCGQNVSGIRLSATNRLAGEIDRTAAILRAATTDDVFAVDVDANDRRLTEESVGLLASLRRRVHGETKRSDVDKPAIKAWTSAGLDRRAHFASAAQRAGFCGATSAVSEITFLGVRAPGVVAALDDTGFTVNNNPRITVTIDVTPATSEAFRTADTMVVSRLALPRLGDAVDVRFDPADHSNFVFRLVPGSSTG